MTYNPVWNDADLLALAALSGTGFPTRTGAGTWSQRSVTGTANQITATDGDGVAGAPTLSLPSAVTMPGSLVVTTTLQVDGNTTLGNAVSDTTTANGTLTQSANQNATTTFSVLNSDTTNSTSRAAVVVQGGSCTGRLMAIHGSIFVVGSLTASDVALQRNGTTVATVTATNVNLASGIGIQINANTVITSERHQQLRSYTVGTLPSAATAAQLIYVSDETGGAVPAFSDGTNWRRVTDRNIVA